jgi:hypothetical protein
MPGPLGHIWMELPLQQLCSAISAGDFMKFRKSEEPKRHGCTERVQVASKLVASLAFAPPPPDILNVPYKITSVSRPSRCPWRSPLQQLSSHSPKRREHQHPLRDSSPPRQQCTTVFTVSNWCRQKLSLFLIPYVHVDDDSMPCSRSTFES